MAARASGALELVLKGVFGPGAQGPPITAYVKSKNYGSSRREAMKASQITDPTDPKKFISITRIKKGLTIWLRTDTS